MSTFTTFMFGWIAGVAVACLTILITCRCRFGFHKWGAWKIAGNGGSQFHICSECNYYAVEMFRDFTVKVIPPAVVSQTPDEAEAT